MTKALIADVGGTNIRLGIAENKQVHKIIKYTCAQFKSTEDVIQSYLSEVGERPDYFVAGAAGEINENGQIELTNSPFRIDLKDICSRFGFKRGLLSNDVVFHSIKALDLPVDGWQELNPETSASQKNPSSCVIVVGTGFGGAYSNDGCVEASEPGHHEAIPSKRGGKVDENVWRYMREEREGIWEDFISGPSSLRIYQYLTAIRTDRDMLARTPKEVTEFAHQGDEAALKTYKVMARFLAQFLGQEVPDRHLSNIYLGGLVREILSIPEVRHEFLETLYDRPGKYASKYSKKASIRLIKTDDNLAMGGLAAVADDLVKTGTTTRILKRDVRLFDLEKEQVRDKIQDRRASIIGERFSQVCSGR